MSKITRQILAGTLTALLAFFGLGGASARGQGCPPMYSEYFDGVTPPVLPSGWSASQGVNITGAPLWVTSPITPQTPPNDVFSTAPANILDNRLDTPVIYVRVYEHTVTFRQSYNLENGFDGAVLEVSAPNINGGAFTDITDPAVGGTLSPGYNTVISSDFQSPIAGRMAWSGNSGGYIYTWVHIGTAIPEYTHVALRFRLVADNKVASAGWRIDNFDWHHNECNPPIPTPTATATATATATPVATPTPTPVPAQPLNISTRTRVETGDNVMIGGFIITGTEPKKVALRGLGPSLSDFGLSGVLADPALELRGSGGALLMQNNNWQDDPAQAAQLATLGLALQEPNESGIVVTLPPEAYTAILTGNNQTTGVGLVEIYDADPAAGSRLANISTRGFVQTGDNVMIGGFILGQGSASSTVVVRGLGPSLSQSGLSNVLADPTLELRDNNGALLIANDDWQDEAVSAAQLTAQGLAPLDPLESGIFATLPPGGFTAILAGKEGGVGLGLVEMYGDIRESTLTVTSTADSGVGSLRDAIAAARDGDTIQFAAALKGQTISLTSAGLVIDKDITIRGPGRDALAVSKASTSMPYFGIFHVLPGHTVVMEGLTISHAYGIHGGHPGIVNDHATLTLKDSTVCCNYGGGIRSYGSDATMTIINSMVTGNFLEVTPGIVAVGAGGGAGISNYGTLTVSSSIVTDNFIGSSPFHPAPPLAGGDGGGIFNGGLLTMSDSTVSANVANRWGGGIDNRGTAEITASTISGNHAQFYGGGVSNSGEFSPVGQGTLTISNSTVYGNSVSYKEFSVGGGVYNAGPLTITHSTISANYADGAGGGIINHGMLQIGNSILSTGTPANVVSQSGTFTSLGYNLSSDDGAGLLTGTGDQINTTPMLGPLQDNGGPTFTHALLMGSPALNAGDPNFSPPPIYDQRGPGYDRVVGGRIDVGSFEVQP